MGPKPANAALFNGNGDFMGGKQLADQLFVQRFGEAQVSDGGGQALRLQYVGGLKRLLQSRTQRENGDLLAFAHDTALANRKPLRDGRQRGSGAISERRTSGDGTAIEKQAETSRVGAECVSTCRDTGSPAVSQQKHYISYKTK